MKYIVSVDIGTTSVKTGLYNKKLDVIGFISEEYALLTPKKDYIELDPEVYWQAVTRSVNSLVMKHLIRAADVSAIAICSQGETLIPVDCEGKPLYNAVVWIDTRAGQEAEHLRSIIGDDLYYHTTGLNEFWSANPICKLLWLKNNRPDIYSKTAKFLLLTDFIAYRLCGQMVSEWTMMCSTGYYDINRHEIWQTGLKAAGLDADKVPEVQKSGVPAGIVLPDVAQQMGVSENTKVIICANDQMAGAVGGGNTQPGIVTETTGTALVITATVDKPDYDLDPRIIYYLHVKGDYLIVPYTSTAGILLKWFKDEFCGPEATQARTLGTSVYDLLGQMASETPPLAHGLMLYPHFAGKVSPNNNPDAKGIFFNVGLECKKAHFVRAIFEGIAYILRENVTAIENCGININEVRSLGGGARSDVWNQIKADVLGKPIVTLERDEATSLGVAMIAAVSLGWFANLDIAGERVIAIRKKYYPNPDQVKLYDHGYAFYKKMESQMQVLFSDRFYDII